MYGFDMKPTAEELSVKHSELVPISRYHRKLMQNIDEAEWLGDFDTADRLKREEDYIKAEINRGALYVPNF